MRGFFLAPVALYAVAAFVALYAVILSPGTIGLSHDWAIPPYPSQLAQLSDNFRWILWEDIFGYERIWDPWTPQIFELLASAGLGGEQVSKGLVLVSLIVSGCSMYFLCRSIKLNPFPSLLSGFFYMFTPVIFNRVAAGHIWYIISYALSPFAISFFIMALNAKDKRRWLGNTLVGGIFYFLSVPQIHFIGLIFIVMATYAAATIRSLAGACKRIFTLLLVTTICVLLNPLLIVRFGELTATFSRWSVAPYVTMESLFWISENTNLLKALTLTGWVADKFGLGLSPDFGFWHIAALIITILAFSSVLIARTSELRRQVICWSVLAVLFIILANGTASPLGILIWTILYEHFRPFTSLYADIYHMMFIPALAYALLLGISIHNIFHRICEADVLRSGSEAKQLHEPSTNTRAQVIFIPTSPVRFPRFLQTISKSLSHEVTNFKATRIYAVFIVMLLMSSYAYPSIIMYPQQLQTYVWDDSYRQVYDDLAQEEGLFRVLWLPTVAFGLSYRGLKYGGVDPMISFSPKPSFPQLLGPAAAQEHGSGHIAYTGLIKSVVCPYIYEEHTRYLGYLLSFSGIKYVLLRGDAFTYALPEDQYNTSRTILDGQKDVRSLRTVGNITIYENENYLPIVYPAMPRESSLIVGGLNTLVSLSYLTNEAKILPKQKLFVVSSQLKPDEAKSILQKLDNVVVSSDEWYDLAFSLVSSEFKMHPSQFVDGKSWGEADWTVWNLIGEVERPAVGGVPRHSLNISYYAPVSGSYEVWGKVLFSPNSKSIGFSLDGKELSNIVTTGFGANISSWPYNGPEGFRWVNLGKTQLNKGPHTFSVTGDNKDYQLWRRESVALLVAAPSSIIKEAVDASEALLARKNILIISELEKPMEVKSGWDAIRVRDASQGLALNSTDASGVAVYKVFIPCDGRYELYFRLQAKSRSDLHVAIAPEGSSKLMKHNFSLAASQSFSWHNFTTEKLLRGWHRLTISGSRANIVADVVALKPTGSGVDIGDNEVVDFKAVKVNPTLYRVSVNSTSPVFIVHNMNFNRFWRITTEEGFEISPVVANAYAMAYYLNESGLHRLLIRYVNQENYQNAQTITFITWGVLIAAVAILYAGLKISKTHSIRRRTVKL